MSWCLCRPFGLQRLFQGLPCMQIWRSSKPMWARSWIGCRPAGLCLEDLTLYTLGWQSTGIPIWPKFIVINLPLGIQGFRLFSVTVLSSFPGVSGTILSYLRRLDKIGDNKEEGWHHHVQDCDGLKRCITGRPLNFPPARTGVSTFFPATHNL